MNPFARMPTPEVVEAVRDAIAEEAIDSPALPTRLPVETKPPTDDDSNLPEWARMEKLVDDDFPFDDSQLDAIYGMASQRYACLTGAAGTGKTTTTKRLVQVLMESASLESVNMLTYWKNSPDLADGEDEYEIPEAWVPSVAMVGFTGRSTQMIKRNFPRPWHGNIMTIHRLLGFAPTWYTVDEMLNKGEMSEAQVTEKGYRGDMRVMRFEPYYTADMKMPWDMILVDEAGMVGLDLWHQLLAAMKPGCRVYMIGDINQLPPVHGRSVFGFAMAKWPSWELTHVHRQKGKDNPIVDNAWRVLNGQMPISGGAFQMIPLKGDAQMSSRLVRAMMPHLKTRGIYAPNRDTIITPINGEDGSNGFALGQLPLNREFALLFNPQTENVRYIIDGGRERKQFAVGDKVMATRNDYETGITNGMTGQIIRISENPAYAGDHNRFGPIESVNAYMAATGEDEAFEDFDLKDLQDSYAAIEAGQKAKKEKADRGPSSHIVTVQFGTTEHGFEIPFATLAEVGSLMTAYVVTCHKMQGGESPTVVIILHDSHRRMLFREWLYTAITRASHNCILLYTQDALRTALSKQSIRGSTLAEKVAAFNFMQKGAAGIGPLVNVRLQEPEPTEFAIARPEKPAGVPAVIEAEPQSLRPDPTPVPPIVVQNVTHVTVNVSAKLADLLRSTRKSESAAVAVDGGELTPAPVAILSAPTQLHECVNTLGAVRAMLAIESAQQVKLLLAPEAPVKLVSVNPFARLGLKVRTQ
jgi:hypothetical protein